eukprot:CAMPEP_0201544422 /NCGR_PEP_ID=MMETSP0173_2-20130828/1029_1 /ASSEMBLY_ACC=CAM_ASM_000268 /TAXON_ID=218659 /ORGANISM="Vexillifera sp., Strain DIVA3 564/2" /LENGTH=270 /DNA_ID=CAMNT_0047952525 /DNA_START=40 /DNA_END=852 /DNA_ORIENTATION=+
MSTSSTSSSSSSSPSPVITKDPAYIGAIKIYGTGILDDPVTGSKAGKGRQDLISSCWLSALSAFIAKHLEKMKSVLAFCAGLGSPKDFVYLVNMSNQLFMDADSAGLGTQKALDKWLFASWCTLAAAEVDRFAYSKYTAEDREKLRSKFYTLYAQAEAIDYSKAPGKDELGEFYVAPARVDLLPKVAIERLALHNELCALKWGKAAAAWKESGFPLSKRISSVKRHFDGVHQNDFSEDHIAHLAWNFMAIYHVHQVIMPKKPEYDDLIKQ